MDVVPGTFFLLLSTAVGSLPPKDYNCTSEEFEDCLIILKAIAETDDLALPATREELNLVCRKLRKGIICIENHSFHCFTAAQKRIFNSVVSDSRDVIDDLCVSETLKDDYLRYAPCLKNVSTDERKCARQYRKLTYNHDIKTNEPKDIDTDDGLKMHCCAFTEFVQCQHEHLVRDCGLHANNFFQRHLDRMSGSLLNEHCALYTYGSNACIFIRNLAESIESGNFSLFKNTFSVFSMVLAIFFLFDSMIIK